LSDSSYRDKLHGASAKACGWRQQETLVTFSRFAIAIAPERAAAADLTRNWHGACWIRLREPGSFSSFFPAIYPSVPQRPEGFFMGAPSPMLGAMTQLKTKAWLLLGISSLPGELSLRSGQIAFTAHGSGSAWPWQLRKLGLRLGAPGLATAIDAGAGPQVFDWPVRETQAWTPWYYFGGGIKLKRENTVLPFSFAAPGNSKVRSGSVVDVAALREAASSLGDVGLMRRRGKLWQAALRSEQGGGKGDV
jgi:hypothetical protein